MSIAITTRVPFTRALSSRPFALLWTGQTISSLGDGAFTTAVAWQVLILTGSATAMGLILIAQTLPMILFLLLGGVVADRFPRKQVMLLSDASRAVAVFALAVLAMTHMLQLWQLVALALFFGTVRGFFMPAYQSIIPQLVEKDELASANSLTEFSYQLYVLLGPLVGASCVALIGPGAAFGFDGLTFLASAFFLLLLRLPTSALSAISASSSRSKSGVRTTIAELREGLHYVTGSTFLWLSMALAAITAIGGAGALQVALPKLVYDVYGQGVWLLGIMGVIGGIGSLLALLLIPRLNRFRRRGMIVYLSFACAGLAMMAFGLPLPRAMEPVVACIAMTILNLGLTISEVLWITLLQEKVPDDKLGRVSSINQLAGYAMWPLGFALGGITADHISPATVFLGAGFVIVVLYGLALFTRPIRQVQ
ncbi:MAG: MFS transporter [Ktedonobacteraceae bacterium]